MTNGHCITPTAAAELRNVLQGITGHLEVADPTLQRLSLSREHLELWGHRSASVILLMDREQQDVPAVGWGWGVALLATVVLLLAGLRGFWVHAHC